MIVYQDFAASLMQCTCSIMSGKFPAFFPPPERHLAAFVAVDEFLEKPHAVTSVVTRVASFRL